MYLAGVHGKDLEEHHYLTGSRDRLGDTLNPTSQLCTQPFTPKLQLLHPTPQPFTTKTHTGA